MLRGTCLVLLVGLVTCWPRRDWRQSAEKNGAQVAWQNVRRDARELGSAGHDATRDVADRNKKNVQEYHQHWSDNGDEGNGVKRDWNDWKTWALGKWRKGEEKAGKAASAVKQWGSVVAQEVKDVFTNSDEDGKRNVKIDNQADAVKRDWDDRKAWVREKWQKILNADW